jgi:hypothetical protein
MSGKISRLFAASMVPVSLAPGVEPPPVRLEPPALEALAPANTAPLGLSVETQTYTSTGNALRSPLGRAQLSSTSASFEAFKGSMSLEFAGVLPNYPGYRIASEFFAGASVYRVTNADQYFLDNPTICGGKKPNFIVMKFTSLADIQDSPPMAVTLWLSSEDNYADYSPMTFDPCGGDTYKAPKITISQR